MTSRSSSGRCAPPRHLTEGPTSTGSDHCPRLVPDGWRRACAGAADLRGVGAFPRRRGARVGQLDAGVVPRLRPPTCAGRAWGAHSGHAGWEEPRVARSQLTARRHHLSRQNVTARRRSPSDSRLPATFEAPGVGIEPTTSRLTVERICLIELPRTDVCATSEKLAVSSRLDDTSLHFRMAVRAEEDAFPRLRPHCLKRPG
jgi:hypothetical protein